jgi:ATP-dependent 26S proteasome regulatory subunit
METDAGIVWREIARAMDGMSGSEVVHIAQNAAKHSVLEGRRSVGEADIRRALTEILERQQAQE